MSETKKAHEGVVTSIADTDLVMVVGPNGGLHPISFADLAKLVRNTIQIGGRNLIKGTSSLIANNSTAIYIGHKITKPISELKKEKALTFSCKYRKTGNPTGNIYIGAIIVSSYYDHKVISVDSLSENGVISITFTSSLSYPNGGLNLYASSQSGLELYDFQLERGNVATDWSPAPEDIADGTWGGVIGYLPITYNIATEESEKGGAHDADEGVDGCLEIGADGYLAFGSVIDLCGFLGKSSESLSTDDQSETDGGGQCVCVGLQRGNYGRSLCLTRIDESFERAGRNQYDTGDAGSIRQRRLSRATLPACDILSRSYGCENAILRLLDSLEDSDVSNGKEEAA